MGEKNAFEVSLESRESGMEKERRMFVSGYESMNANLSIIIAKAWELQEM